MNAGRLTPGIWRSLAGMLLITIGLPTLRAQYSDSKVAVPAAGGALPPAERSSVTLLHRAEECIRNRQYANAVTLLQSLIDQPQDGYYFADDGRRLLRSLKSRAESLLLAMPPDGRVAYEVAFGGAAKQQFEAAIEAQDEAALKQVMLKYFATQAGLDAAYKLAMHEFDRGEFLTAAGLLARLKRRSERADQFEPQLSLRLAAAWTASGFRDRAQSVLDQLRTRRIKGTARIGARRVAFANLKLTDLVHARNDDQDPHDGLVADWKMLRGNPTRNPITRLNKTDSTSGDIQAWQQTTLVVPRELKAGGNSTTETSNATLEQFKSLSSEYLKRFLGYRKRVFSARSPIVVGNTAVVGTIGNLAGFDLQTGANRWESPIDRTLEMILGDGKLAMNGLLNSFTYQRLWTDKTSDGLAADGRFVYAIENDGLASPVLGMIRSVNSLTAYHAPGTKGDGRVAWTLGGRLRPSVPRVPMRGTFLLGPPLPVGGKLYCIGQVNREIRLLVVDSNRLAVEGSPKFDANADQPFVRETTLAQSSLPIGADLRRRTLGTTPAESGGMIVCPTGEGVCVAVDLFQQQPAWAFDARSASRRDAIRSREPVETNKSQWLGDATVTIVGDRVLYSPADPPTIFCLDHNDGSLIWESRRDYRDHGKEPSKRQDAGVYLAGAWNGRVAVVEHAMQRTGFFQVLLVSSAVRILDVNTGEQLHSARIDKPSGYGVIVDGVLYQPTAKRQIAKIDLASGTVGVIPTPNARTFVNLIYVRGRMVAQSPEWLDVFPISVLDGK